MDEREKRREELRKALGVHFPKEEEPKRRKKWYRTRRNWGMWVLLVAFALYLITYYIIKPILEKGE